MSRQASRLDAQFGVKFIPLPEDKREAWRTSLLLLVNWIVEDLIANPEVGNGLVDVDPVRDDHRVGTSLFSLAHPTQRKRTTQIGCIYAWVIGHDGSAHRMALADWRA